MEDFLNDDIVSQNLTIVTELTSNKLRTFFNESDSIIIKTSHLIIEQLPAGFC